MHNRSETDNALVIDRQTILVPKSRRIVPRAFLYTDPCCEQATGLRGGAAAVDDTSEDEDSDESLGDDDDEDDFEDEDFGEAGFVGRLAQDWKKTPVITRTFFQVPAPMNSEERRSVCVVPQLEHHCSYRMTRG